MDQNGEISSYLPLSEATFLILLSLTPGARHGYAILKAVCSLSQGRVVLSTGTLYGALKRLLELGWIERAGEDGSAKDGRPRKAYALTRIGWHILNAETARLESLVAAARISRPGELHP